MFSKSKDNSLIYTDDNKANAIDVKAVSKMLANVLYFTKAPVKRVIFCARGQNTNFIETVSLSKK